MNPTVKNPDNSLPESGTPPSKVMLEASFDYVPQERLKIRLRILNQSNTDIYVFNRLWALDNDSYPTPDPQVIYRFVRDGGLRLFLGAAPLPRMKTVAYRNIPFTTKVRAKEAYDTVLEIPAPIKEYNPYFREQPHSAYRILKVTRMEVSVQIVEARPDFETVEIPFHPTAIKIITPAVLDFAQVLHANAVPMKMEVLRRTDKFERPN